MMIGLLFYLIFEIGCVLSTEYNASINVVNSIGLRNSKYKTLRVNPNSFINESAELEEELFSEIPRNREYKRPPKINSYFKNNENINQGENEFNFLEYKKFLNSQNKNYLSNREKDFQFSSKTRYMKNKIYKNHTKSFYKNEFFLGLSGNPFASHKIENKIVPTLSQVKAQIDPEEVSALRNKRSVVHLYNMILCTRNCNPAIYKGYGCYCGFLGSGVVVDGIDSCCQRHDHCYYQANCPKFMEYFIPYFWKCYFRQPFCATDQSAHLHHAFCARKLCECDRQLALCLKKYPCPNAKPFCTSAPWRFIQNIFSF